MRKMKEVLRLRFELGLSDRQIARSCSVGLGTVHGFVLGFLESGRSICYIEG